MRRAVAPLLLGLLLAACSLPEGDRSSPEGLHYASLQARQAGEPDGWWELLHPEVRALLERWQAADREARRAIELGYPSGQQEAALESLGPLPGEGVEDARGLFVAFMGRVEPAPLSLLERLGARVREVTVEDGAAVVRTLAGDEIPARQGEDGDWYAMPRPDELMRLQDAARRAQANLERIRRNVAIFNGRRAR